MLMPKPWLRLVLEPGREPRLLPIKPNTTQAIGKVNFSWMRTCSLRAALRLPASASMRSASIASAMVMLLASSGKRATLSGPELKG